MIRSLSVRNLAIVEDLNLEFKTGMTSLTGETGAGKSLLVDALSLVLGDRSDAKMIRYDCERAEIEAEFDVDSNPLLTDWLLTHELDDNQQCHLRRTISTDGRSKAYINGRSVPISKLKEIAELSIDIHGQHAHQSLLRLDKQLDIVDTIAGNSSLLKQLKTCFQQLQKLKTIQLEQQHQAQERTSRKALLEYQIAELEQYELTDEAIQRLIQQQNQLSNVAELNSVVESALFMLVENEHLSAYDTINQALKDIEQFSEIESGFASIIETLHSAIINLDESVNELRHYQDSLEQDPEKLTIIEATLSQLHDLARKHQNEVEQLPQTYESLNAELSELNEAEASLKNLDKDIDSLRQDCLKLCEKISNNRINTATNLSEKISDAIQELAIPGGHFQIQVSTKPDKQFNEFGYDQINFLVSTNPGHAPAELAKVASGGELARISLAIQVATSGKRAVPTLVFDEVDVGIGGGVAEIVGQHLKHLAQNYQIICITHLPQVAVQAHHQLQVSKKLSEDSSHIEISELSWKDRIQETARMLGGIKLTQKTLNHAQEMLDHAQMK